MSDKFEQRFERMNRQWLAAKRPEAAITADKVVAPRKQDKVFCNIEGRSVASSDGTELWKVSQDIIARLESTGTAATTVTCREVQEEGEAYHSPDVGQGSLQ